MQVGLLAIQGAFRDHLPHLKALQVPYRLVVSAHDLPGCDRLIIPGGESTVMAKFLRAYNLAGPLKDRISMGMPVWGICAGAILLAALVDGRQGPLAVLDISIKRNAYGRQLASCTARLDFPVLAKRQFEAIFIRAPRILNTSEKVKIHGCLRSDPVFVQQGRVMATTFHPELTADPVFHRYFLDL